jgi:hypothetical protein
VTKILVELDLTPAEAKMLAQNSVERVLNNAIRVGGWVEEHLDGGPKMSDEEQTMAESGSTLWQDCEELKPLVVKIWWAVHEEVFKRRLV